MHMTRSPSQIIYDANSIIPLKTFVALCVLVAGGFQVQVIVDLLEIRLISQQILLILVDNLPAHGHGDALSFEWTVRVKEFLLIQVSLNIMKALLVIILGQPCLIIL